MYVLFRWRQMARLCAPSILFLAFTSGESQWQYQLVWFADYYGLSHLYSLYCSLLSPALDVVCKLKPTIIPVCDSSLDKMRGSHPQWHRFKSTQRCASKTCKTARTTHSVRTSIAPQIMLLCSQDSGYIHWKGTVLPTGWWPKWNPAFLPFTFSLLWMLEISFSEFFSV